MGNPKKSMLRNIKNQRGNIIMEEDDMERWKEYF